MSESLQKAIKQLSKTGEEVFAKLCAVTKVDELKKTIDVMPIDGEAEIFDLPFNPNVAINNGLFLSPKNGSIVLVVFINNHHAHVCAISEVDKVLLKIGDVEMKVTIDGFVIKKEGESLQKLVNDLLEAIKKMVFTTNAGPTINLVNVAEFEALKTRFNNLLKDS